MKFLNISYLVIKTVNKRIAYEALIQKIARLFMFL